MDSFESRPVEEQAEVTENAPEGVFGAVPDENLPAVQPAGESEGEDHRDEPVASEEESIEGSVEDEDAAINRSANLNEDAPSGMTDEEAEEKHDAEADAAVHAAEPGAGTEAVTEGQEQQ